MYHPFPVNFPPIGLISSPADKDNMGFLSHSLEYNQSLYIIYL